jgi:hypothetical protein
VLTELVNLGMAVVTTGYAIVGFERKQNRSSIGPGFFMSICSN